MRVADTKTSDVDVVTQPDRESEALIRRIVLERRPGDAFLGEESGSASGSSGVRWVVDPIDGTVNYLYGLPEYSVSIAVEVGGQVVAGVVINAATGVEYVATAGRRPPRRRAPRRPRAGVPSTSGWSSPVSGTTPTNAPSRRPRSRGCSRTSATSAGSARALWTCVTSPRAAPTPTSRRA